MSTVDIFNQLINQYTGSINNIQSGSITLGLEIFNSIALISVALLGLNHLLRRNVDMVEANIELIKWLMYLIFFYGFITNYPNIYPIIFNSIQQIGTYLGGKASGTVINITPENIINIGFHITKKIFSLNLKFGLIRDFFMVVISILAGVVVMYCFAVITLELILVQIGSQVILAGGIFLLAFSSLQWTRDYAERYVHTFFHIGIKMVFIYILVGLGVGLANNWAQILDQAPQSQIIDDYIAVTLSTFIFYKLCIKIPDQAVSFLTGRLSMGFDSAASVNAAMAIPSKTIEVAKKIAEGYKHVKDFSTGLATNMQGNAKAYDAAKQNVKDNFQAQGKTVGDQEIINATIKTLGEAKSQVNQEAWDKKVGDTLGGKILKNISDKTPPPKPVIEDYTI